MTADAQSLLDDLISRALKLGADAADAVAANAVSLSHAQRLGKMERLERAGALSRHLVLTHAHGHSLGRERQLKKLADAGASVVIRGEPDASLQGWIEGTPAAELPGAMVDPDAEPPDPAPARRDLSA